MLIDEGVGTSAVAWVRAAQNAGGAGVSVVYVRPRLFLPYHAETKVKKSFITNKLSTCIFIGCHIYISAQSYISYESLLENFDIIL